MLEIHPNGHTVIDFSDDEYFYLHKYVYERLANSKILEKNGLYFKKFEHDPEIIAKDPQPSFEIVEKKTNTLLFSFTFWKHRIGKFLIEKRRFEYEFIATRYTDRKHDHPSKREADQLYFIGEDVDERDLDDTKLNNGIDEFPKILRKSIESFIEYCIGKKLKHLSLEEAKELYQKSSFGRTRCI